MVDYNNMTLREELTARFKQADNREKERALVLLLTAKSLGTICRK